MKEVRAFVGEDTNYYWVKEVIPEPLAYCLHSVKVSIQDIIESVGATTYQGYLTGKKQFREKIATIRPYKGNRDPSHKPFYYNEITDYMIDRWGAKVIDHYEADDKMVMDQIDKMTLTNHDGNYVTRIPAEASSIICTIDKDLDQCPGWHYNFVKKEKYWVSEEDALRWFYVQLIAGDQTDNIQGVPNYGITKAVKALANCNTELDMYEVAVDLYNKAFIDESLAMTALLETAKLVYMVKEEGVEWSPPV